MRILMKLKIYVFSTGVVFIVTLYDTSPSHPLPHDLPNQTLVPIGMLSNSVKSAGKRRKRLGTTSADDVHRWMQSMERLSLYAHTINEDTGHFMIRRNFRSPPLPIAPQQRPRQINLHSRFFSSAPIRNLAQVQEEPPPPLNRVFVPLISPVLHEQLFPPETSKYAPPPPAKEAVQLAQDHLKLHGLWNKAEEAANTKHAAPAIQFTLPSLQGETISHHFHALAEYSAEPYLTLAKETLSFKHDQMPYEGTWSINPGWTYYYPDGSFECIEYPPPEDDVLVFDVETLPYLGGDYPIMAVAVGKKGWYGWVSPWLSDTDKSPKHLIPLSASNLNAHTKSGLLDPATAKPRLVIGHNVLFDRARVSSEYALQRPSTRWIDTMSLHIATNGISSPQRLEWLYHKKKREESEQLKISTENLGEKFESYNMNDKVSDKHVWVKPLSKDWKDVSSTASLVEVARLHLGKEIDKSMRDALIDPRTTIEEIRSSFQNFMSYCAMDVLTTLQVYQAVLPKFLQQCPHPASFSGILTMSQAVLPVDYRWPKYLENAESSYQDRILTIKTSLAELAETARSYHDKRDPTTGLFVWESDPWLNQLDWSPKRARRLEKIVKQSKTLLKRDKINAERVDPLNSFPFWYASALSTTVPDHAEIPIDDFLTPLLLKVTWRRYPVVYTKSQGWMFAVAKTSLGDPFLPEANECFVSPYDLRQGGDHVAASLTQFQLYTLPNKGKKNKIRKLFQSTVAKLVSNGDLCSPYAEFATVMTHLKNIGHDAHEELRSLTSKLAGEARQMPAAQIKDDPWLTQLDWTPCHKPELEAGETSATSQPTTENGEVEERTITHGDLVWPKWYYDLDVPGAGLEVTTKKRVAPHLLKLRWKGQPLFHSKEHGWIYLASSKSDGPKLKFEDSADIHLAEKDQAIFYKIPHPDGSGKSVGQPLSKSFVKAFEDGFLSSEYPLAASVLDLNASCSYWQSSRERITEQLVVWDGEAKKGNPSESGSQGIILPQVVPMGTVTRRSVEKTWLTASNAKKNRVGSELKSMVKAPPGYAIVGADVDSEELWICSVMGDAQFGLHGATAVGWMTLEGSKGAGTDLHSNSAKILGISRDDAKVFNYSRIYGAGVKHATELLVKCNPNLSELEANKLAKSLYASTKGLSEKKYFRRSFWHGGTESYIFNKLEEIALAAAPKTPTLGCGITVALSKKYLNDSARRSNFMTSRVNWVVQSSGVDYLHLLIVSMEYLIRRYSIDARYMISVHDEIRYLVKEQDKHRAAMALQISNLWVRALFSYRLRMESLPQSCAFFSAVDLDNCFRKEVNMSCVTPSNPEPIPFGESLDISACLASTNGGSLFSDGRSMKEDDSLGQLTLSRQLTPDEICLGEHRESNMAFLTAQNSTDSLHIRSLWKSVQFGLNAKRISQENQRPVVNIPSTLKAEKAKNDAFPPVSLDEYLRSIDADMFMR